MPEIHVMLDNDFEEEQYLSYSEAQEFLGQGAVYKTAADVADLVAVQEFEKEKPEEEEPELEEEDLVF